MNPLIQLKTTPPLLITLALLCFALSPKAQAVVPPPDGGYPGFNTAEGQNALFSLTTGAANTAVGWFSLFSDTEAASTPLPARERSFSTHARSNNTAFGAAALLFNTTGFNNTAIGAAALYNTTGSNNTASGHRALFSNTTGGQNTANGLLALSTALTAAATRPTACKRSSATQLAATTLPTVIKRFIATPPAATTRSTVASAQCNTTGNYNTHRYIGALSNTRAPITRPSACKRSLATPLAATTRLAVIKLASISRATAMSASARVSGAAGVDDTTWIRNVYASVASGRAVYVNSDNKIGRLSSSVRYKEEIKPMDKASETVFALKPVTFRYKKAVDSSQALSFGLIAEEVAQVNPVLITRDEHGKPQTVRYEMVNAMLLNEFLKEHRTVHEQGAKITRQRKDFEVASAQQQKQIEALTAMVKEQAAQIQKVSAQIELNKSAPETVSNIH